MHVIPDLKKGGAERLAIDIIRNLLNEGHDCRLVIFRNIIEYDISEIEEFIVYLEAWVQLSVLRRHHYHLGALQAFLRDFTPDIIHTHLFEAEVVSRACTFPAAKWFSHCHDNMVQFSGSWWKNKQSFTNRYEKRWLFQRYLTNGGTHFIAISNHTATYFTRHQTVYPVTTMPNAIEVARFRKPDEDSHQRTVSLELRLINVGSFVPKKNQRLFIDIVAELKSRGVHVVAHVIGDGPMRSEIEDYVNSHGEQDIIIMPGIVDATEEWYWGSDIYVHTASYEPFGLVLLEAMAAGLPVVALDGGGNRDIVLDGLNGYLITEPDPALFADKIMAVWDDKDVYQQMSRQAAQFAGQYDIGAYTSKLLALYQEALKNE